MALSAGFHRLPKKPSDKEHTKKRAIFWLVYSLDKALSLSLGRPSTIQDFDISTERLGYPDEVQGPMGKVQMLWADLGKLQGDIYYELYSAHAQKQSVQFNADLARQLAVRCLKIRNDMRFVSRGIVCG